MIVTVTWLFAHGIGIFGNNTTIVWGFPIANYVWWLGIGHAGTLISALLLLTRQKWRASLNRFAETMTLFAVVAGRAVPDLSSGPAVLSLLDHALSERPGAVAAMAQRPGLGFLGGRHLHHLLRAVLVCRPDSRPRHAARPRAAPQRRGGSTALSHWAGAARRGIGRSTSGSIATWRRSRCRWWSRCTASSASTSRRAWSPAGTTRSIRLISWSARCIPASPWSW